MQAVKCPVCNGSGKYTMPYGTKEDGEEKTCHGCGGKGWVSVGVDYPIYPIYPPYDPYPNPYIDPYIIWTTTTTWDDTNSWSYGNAS